MIEIGQGGLIKISTGKIYDPATGERFVERWYGNKESAEAMYLVQVNSGNIVSIEPDEGGPKATLTISSPGNVADGTDYVKPTWELIPTLESIDTWQHPTVAAFTAGMSETALGLFAKAVQDYVTDGTWSPDFDTMPAAIKGFIRHRRTEDVNFFAPRPTLRLSLVVPWDTSYVIDYAGMLVVYTTAQLLATPLLFDYPLPTSIGALPVGEWLWSPPTQQQMQDGRIQIGFEFMFQPTGGWDTSFKYVHA